MLLIAVRYCVDREKCDLLERIEQALDRAEIEIPYPFRNEVLSEYRSNAERDEPTGLDRQDEQ